MAWDGLGQNPGQNEELASTSDTAPQAEAPFRRDPDAKRERALATLDPRSSEWQVLHDQIEADREKRLRAQLRICSDCLPSESKTTKPTRSVSDVPSVVSR